MLAARRMGRQRWDGPAEHPTASGGHHDATPMDEPGEPHPSGLLHRGPGRIGGRRTGVADLAQALARDHPRGQGLRRAQGRRQARRRGLARDRAPDQLRGPGYRGARSDANGGQGRLRRPETLRRHHLSRAAHGPRRLGGHPARRTGLSRQLRRAVPSNLPSSRRLRAPRGQHQRRALRSVGRRDGRHGRRLEPDLGGAGHQGRRPLARGDRHPLRVAEDRPRPAGSALAGQHHADLRAGRRADHPRPAIGRVPLAEGVRSRAVLLRTERGPGPNQILAERVGRSGPARPSSARAEGRAARAQARLRACARQGRRRRQGLVDDRRQAVLRQGALPESRLRRDSRGGLQRHRHRQGQPRREGPVARAERGDPRRGPPARAMGDAARV